MGSIHKQLVIMEAYHNFQTFHKRQEAEAEALAKQQIMEATVAAQGAAAVVVKLGELVTLEVIHLLKELMVEEGQQAQMVPEAEAEELHKRAKHLTATLQLVEQEEMEVLQT